MTAYNKETTVMSLRYSMDIGGVKKVGNNHSSNSRNTMGDNIQKD